MHLSCYNSKKHPVTFLIGAPGVGKTEIALNLSLWKLQNYGKVTLVDMDIVNPFFRVRKLAEHIKSKGVKVVTPIKMAVSGDLPALPPDIWGALEDRTTSVVLDIGGGEQGLRPLGRVKELAQERDANVFFVINNFRPEFASFDEIEKNFDHMQKLSSMQATHIIANPNLSSLTPTTDFIEGLEVITNFARQKKIELAFAVAERQLAESLNCNFNFETRSPFFELYSDMPLFVIDRFWSVPWSFGT